MTATEIRTAAWYGDLSLELAFPAGWTVDIRRPDLPPALGPERIEAALHEPIGVAPLEALAKGKRDVVLIVDDLTRPTPAGRILEHVLPMLERAGVGRDRVTLLVAAGTHGPPTADAMARKIGPAAVGYRTVAHDDRSDCPRIGRTTRGTSVRVNRLVRDADLVIGIGGVYPQHSTGFGGGSKVALGVLGRSSIAALHDRHPSMAGSYSVDNAFRADLAEIGRMIGLRWMVMVHVDERRDIVRAVAGDPEAAYPDAVAFSHERYRAALPGTADVVISNAYPMDTSATFMRSKGVIPLLHTGPSASRVLLAACPEGVGHHGLFPLVPATGMAGVRRRAELVRTRGWREVARIGAAGPRRVVRRVRRGDPGSPATVPHPILFHRTIAAQTSMPPRIPGMDLVASWPELIERIRQEQGDRPDLRVVVYPCAPLQVLE